MEVGGTAMCPTDCRFLDRPEYSACIILQLDGTEEGREGSCRETRRHNVDAGNLEDSKNRFYNGVPRPRAGGLVGFVARIPSEFFHRDAAN